MMIFKMMLQIKNNKLVNILQNALNILQMLIQDYFHIDMIKMMEGN